MPASFAPCSPLQRDEIVVGDHLGADEALLEIGVDDARRPAARCAPHAHRPRAHFLRPGGEVRLQARAARSAAWIRRSRPGSVMPMSARNSALSSASSSAICASSAALIATTGALSALRVRCTRSSSGLSVEAVLGDVGDVQRRLHRQQEVAASAARAPRRRDRRCARASPRSAPRAPSPARRTRAALPCRRRRARASRPSRSACRPPRDRRAPARC